MITLPITVTDVHDGDTIKTNLALQLLDFEMKATPILRLYGINTPELNKPEQKEAAVVARDALSALLDGKQVEFLPIKKDSFGRWLSYVYVIDGDTTIDVNQYMLDKGYAVVYKK